MRYRILSFVIMLLFVCNLISASAYAEEVNTGSFGIIYKVIMPTEYNFIVDPYELLEEGTRISSQEYNIINKSSIPVKMDLSFIMSYQKDMDLDVKKLKGQVNDDSITNEIWLAAVFNNGIDQIITQDQLLTTPRGDTIYKYLVDGNTDNVKKEVEADQATGAAEDTSIGSDNITGAADGVDEAKSQVPTGNSEAGSENINNSTQKDESETNSKEEQTQSSDTMTDNFEASGEGTAFNDNTAENSNTDVAVNGEVTGSEANSQASNTEENSQTVHTEANSQTTHTETNSQVSNTEIVGQDSGTNISEQNTETGVNKQDPQVPAIEQNSETSNDNETSQGSNAAAVDKDDTSDPSGRQEASEEAVDNKDNSNGDTSATVPADQSESDKADVKEKDNLPKIIYSSHTELENAIEKNPVTFQDTINVKGTYGDLTSIDENSSNALVINNQWNTRSIILDHAKVYNLDDGSIVTGETSENGVAAFRFTGTVSASAGWSETNLKVTIKVTIDQMTDDNENENAKASDVSDSTQGKEDTGNKNEQSQQTEDIKIEDAQTNCGAEEGQNYTGLGKESERLISEEEHPVADT